MKIVIGGDTGESRFLFGGSAQNDCGSYAPDHDLRRSFGGRGLRWLNVDAAPAFR
jgi:hypothetical protein